MTELTDLEICKRIAEIEGLKTQSSGDVLFLIERIECSSLIDEAATREYNPMEDWSITGPLMFSHGIRYEGRKMGGKHRFWWGNIRNKNYISNNNPQRAICLAIIEKESNK